MSLYLVHGLLIMYLACCINGPLTFPGENATKEEKEEFDEMRKLPGWGIPIHWIVSVLFAYLLTRFLEEPGKNYLRKRWSRKVESGAGVEVVLNA